MNLSPAQRRMLAKLADDVTKGFHHGTGDSLVREGLARRFEIRTITTEYDGYGCTVEGGEHNLSFYSVWQITAAGRAAIGLPVEAE